MSFSDISGIYSGVTEGYPWNTIFLDEFKDEANQLGNLLADRRYKYLRSIIDFQILYLLYRSPLSGYDLQKKMEQEFKIRLSFGTLFPHLVRYEKLHLITGTWHVKGESSPRSKRKRVFRLTEEGSKLLEDSLSLFSRMYQSVTARYTELAVKPAQRSAAS